MQVMRMVVCLTVMVVLLSPATEGVVSCPQLQGYLQSCLGYLRGGPLTKPCCSGVLSVAATARNVADRRAACRCLVAAAQNLRGVIDMGNASRLPGKCGVNIPFQISPNTNCARYYYYYYYYWLVNYELVSLFYLNCNGVFCRIAWLWSYEYYWRVCVE